MTRKKSATDYTDLHEFNSLREKSAGFAGSARDFTKIF